MNENPVDASRDVGHFGPHKTFLVFEDFLFKTYQIGEIPVGKVELVVFNHRDNNPNKGEIETQNEQRFFLRIWINKTCLNLEIDVEVFEIVHPVRENQNLSIFGIFTTLQLVDHDYDHVDQPFHSRAVISAFSQLDGRVEIHTKVVRLVPSVRISQPCELRVDQQVERRRIHRIKSSKILRLWYSLMAPRFLSSVSNETTLFRSLDELLPALMEPRETYNRQIRFLTIFFSMTPLPCMSPQSKSLSLNSSYSSSSGYHFFESLSDRGCFLDSRLFAPWRRFFQLLCSFPELLRGKGQRGSFPSYSILYLVSDLHKLFKRFSEELRFFALH